MTPEELKKILDDAIKPLTDRLEKVEAANTTIVANIEAVDKIKAAVEPLAVALDTQATALETAGINADSLRAQASHLRSEAAAGRKPTTLLAGAPAPKPAATTNDDAVKALIAAALAPVQAELEVTKTKLTDATNKQRLEANAPARKTISPSVSSIMSKTGITLPEEGKTLNAAEVDKMLASANIALPQRIMLKTELSRAGALS